jgi:glycosyltransferase involved in cell wall biosynthesis
VSTGLKFRVAVINSHPIQYFAPLYAYLCRDSQMEVTALYCSDFSLRGEVDPGFKKKVSWDVDLTSGYPSIFLGEGARRRRPGGFFSLVCPQVWTEVRNGAYDAVWLHGYAYAAYVLAFLAAKSRGLPVFVRSETHLGLARSGWRRRVRDLVLAVAGRFVDGCLAIGSANAEYYRSLGIPEEKIFMVPYTVDNDRFVNVARQAAPDRVALLRQYGLPEDRLVVLYASKFMRRKHPDDVVAAVGELKRQGVRVSLLMVGTGEMDSELRQQVVGLGLDDQIAFAGFINQGELPRIYAASDVFVLPAEDEPWGLIVNEVLCAGLPVVVSSEVGCVPDLVKDGLNGFHMRAGDVPSLVRALSRLTESASLRREMSRAGLAIISQWSYEQCRIGLRQALESLKRNK